MKTYARKTSPTHCGWAGARGCTRSQLVIWAGVVRPKTSKTEKKVKCDGPTEGLTDGPTKQGVESRSTRLKKRFITVDMIKISVTLKGLEHNPL